MVHYCLFTGSSCTRAPRVCVERQQADGDVAATREVMPGPITPGKESQLLTGDIDEGISLQVNHITISHMTGGVICTEHIKQHKIC